ncbi:MFS transporter [Thalassorhabdus alkalitolerans]|uniref:MFS transporter n=1 Tax=Thalassorhabdus alkalitolerans TaxID=2282697 RepID=A0ABW0YII0_9BACI
METSNPKLWSKDFILMSLITFFIALTYFLTITTIAGYAMEGFNATEGIAGLAASVFVIGVLIFRILTGKYIDIIGRKKLLFIALILAFFCTLLYFLAGHLNLLLFIRFLHGALVGIVLTVMQIAVIDIIPVKRQGEGISYYTLSFILATAIGPFLGLLMIQLASINMIFITCTILTGIGILLTLFTTLPKVVIKKEQLEELKGFHFSQFFEKKAISMSLLMTVLALCFSGIITFLASYSMEINLTYVASFFFIIYSVCIFISRPITGRILDTKGENIVMYPAFILFAAGFIVLGQANIGFTLILASILAGLGYGNLQSSIQAIAVKKAPPHRAGLAASTYFIFNDIGIGIGPFILGFFIPLIGYQNLYFSLSIIVIVCAFAYYVIHGKHAVKLKDHHISHHTGA